MLLLAFVLLWAGSGLAAPMLCEDMTDSGFKITVYPQAKTDHPWTWKAEIENTTGKEYRSVKLEVYFYDAAGKFLDIHRPSPQPYGRVKKGRMKLGLAMSPDLRSKVARCVLEKVALINFLK